MKKNILFYIIAFALLVVSLFFFSNTYRHVIEYTRLTDRSNMVYSSFQNLSREVNNAAVINPELLRASNTQSGIKLFMTDSASVIKRLELLSSVVKDSVNIRIAANLNLLIREELAWILESNVPDSITHQQSGTHVSKLKSIYSLLEEGIKRTDFLLAYRKEKLNEAIVAQQRWMIAFIIISAMLISWFILSLYRYKYRIKSIEDDLSITLNRIKDGVISLDNDWRYTFVNDTSVRINNRKRKDLIGQTIWNVHPEVSNTPFGYLLYEAKNTRQVKELETFNNNLNTWLTVKIYPSNDGMTIYYADITERKKVAEQQNLLASIINSSEDAIISKTLNGIVTSWNRGAETIFGYSAAEMIGNSILAIIPTELLNEEFLIMSKIKRGQYIEHYETERVRKDGQRINISLSVSPVLDNNGNVVGASKIGRDITESKKAAIAILAANKEKNMILESIDDAFFAVDKNWVVTYWNNQAEKKLHKDKKDILGYDLWQVFADSVGSASYKKYHEALVTGQPVHFEDYYEPVNKWYEISAYPSANGLSVYFKDISSRKSSEIHLMELNKNLQYQAKELARSNSELEQFAYVASHDLQEPLRMVSSFLTQLEKKYAGILDEKGKIYIGFAVDGAKRMRQIILDLLEFSRVGKMENKKEELDINKLIKEIKILFRKDVEDKQATIQTFALPVTYTYKVPVYQVFHNLISNALKYAAAGRPCVIEISAEDKQTHWQFMVADNGIGIREEFFEKIFIIFQRLHNKDDYSGTGMGLAITKKIVDNLGGRIWVTSAEDKGSTFYFTIEK